MDTDALREVLLKLVQCTETDNRQMHTKNVSLIIKQKRPKITGDLIFQTVISFKAIYYSKKKQLSLTNLLNPRKANCSCWELRE